MGTDHPAAHTELLLANMRALGVSLADLQAAAAGDAPRCPTLHDYLVDKVLPNLTAGKAKLWGPYFSLLDAGYPGLCRCTCTRCLASFRGDSTWVRCHCVAAGRCDCRRDDLDAVIGGAGTCLDGFAGYGTRTVDAFDLHDLQHGSSAVEHLRAAVSCLFTQALAVRLPGVVVNVGLQMDTPKRRAVEARAYGPEQLEELWQALFTSGSDDPELDMLLV